ncbi:PolC-type DNA polymerase III [Anaeromicrobium sediminis]|uniref:DNA polymerase III PolC-type n=1 Tax=Anaeromicrobium sediminis TaxID=1478221 RepID=A0A267MR68_9FIRM|nr:PolC-type DNA polymerase III [Anaeromicrobium sediminis]PAB61230.1 PolC-type DNA polymerase III [Anaeromicrobium sediminis]
MLRLKELSKKFNIDKVEKDNVVVDKIVYDKKNKKLNIIINADEIIKNESLDILKGNILKELNFISQLSLKMKYNNLSIKDNIKSYWPNIVHALKDEHPSIVAWLNEPKIEFKDEYLNIILENNMGIDYLKNKSIDYFIKQNIKNAFDEDLKIQFLMKNNDIKEYLKEKDAQTQSMVKDMVVREERSSFKSDTKKDEENNSIDSIGKKITDGEVPTYEITDESGMVVVKGELIDVEIRELKSGKFLFNMSITDYKGTIGVKLFVKKEDKEGTEALFKKGQFYKVRGEARYDTFSKEVIVMARDVMRSIPIDIREDFEKEKRVELHAHTQMSSMDGVVSASALVSRAAKWGHKAIAITDHGVVQAFPEAMSAAKKNNIKVLYGVEGYLADDGEPIVVNPNNLDLDQTFIVFDIETTGLSSKNDKITEIGAVKIKDGEVIDSFNELINPQKPIPSKIVELTGITNEMVRNKPTIEEILPKFMEFIEDYPVVAHNASFDTSFIIENCERINKEFNNPILDTLKLSKILLPKLKRYRLNVVAKELGIKLVNHHRAVDDAKATGEIFIKFLDMLKEKDINRLDEINKLYSDLVDVKKLDTYHIVILVKNYKGLKNLYKIISEAHMKNFYKRPRITKSMLSSMREGLIIGTACEAGELYKAILSNKSEKEIEEIAKYYDYLEIQPICNNTFLIEKGLVADEEELKDINIKIVNLGEKLNKPVVGTGDVHFLDPKDEVYRRILMAGQGFSDADKQTPLYFKTTEEMLDEFSYLGKDMAKEVVITNTNKIADMVESILPIPDGTFPPIIEGSDEDLRNMCYEKAKRIYGDPIPDIVIKRLDRELNSIISNGYAVMYIISQKLVTKSLEDGYLVGSRGSVGSSFVATMSDITEVNPLPPHYVCPKCKHSEFITDGSIGSGADLPDKNCPKCESVYIKDGHEIPFEVFLGFEGDKEPDIDLNFAGEYQPTAHKYTEELFGEGHVYRAGTIGTIAEKTAYGFVKKYHDEREKIVNFREIDRLSKGCTGVKRTTGQHPGGVMVVPHYKDVFDFSPIQYPANDSSSGVITMHFDYHSISGRILKLDILGHDVPTIIRMLHDITGIDPTHVDLGDKETISIFTSPKALKIQDEEFKCEVGSLGVPEFGTKFVRQMLVDTQPTTFAELVRISGLSHGTDVWLNNAQDLVRQNIAQLKDVISTRDDIMNYLILKGLPPKSAFKIMENVRKGKGLSEDDEEMMIDNKVPNWYIESCKKIKYMFPKAHAVAYVMMSFRLAYFKVHHPLAFYATYFTIKASDFDAELVSKGKETIREKIKELENMPNNLTQKEKDLLTVLEVVDEMYSRGFDFKRVDIYKSHYSKFQIEDEKLLPPLIALQGVGENAAKSIYECKDDGEFISMEDLRTRAKVTKTVIETLRIHGCLKGLPETNQLSLF